MALARNLYRKQNSRFSGCFFKIICSLFLLLIILFAGIVLFFNGNNIKEPLLKLLNERTSINLDVEKIEFSALYPNIIKLHNIKLGSSHIDELYLEYNLKSALNSQQLEIEDLYARGAFISKQDLKTITKNNIGFDKINIKNISLVDSNLEGEKFIIENAHAKFKNFELTNIKASSQEVQIIAPQSKLLNYAVKNLRFKGSFDNEKIAFDKLSLNTEGGLIKGAGIYEAQSQNLKFDNLEISNLVIKDHFAENLNISAPKCSISNISVALNQKDIYLGELSGTLSNLSWQNKDFSTYFLGKSGEISFPNLNITLDDNDIEANIGKTILLNSKGNYLEGSYNIDAQYAPTSNRFEIRDFTIKNSKIEPKKEILDKTLGTLKSLNTSILNLNLENVSFISHIDALALSIDNLSLFASGFKITDEGFKPNANASTIQAKLEDAFYSDLYFKNLSFLANITDDIVNINIPNLTFRSSVVSVALTYNKTTEQLYSIANAKDFELAELNSSLIPHLLSGKINFDCDIKGKYNDLNSFTAMQGDMHISGNRVLISNFGIDLINGGEKKNFILKNDELLNALRDADVGLINPEIIINFNQDIAKLNATTKTSSSNINAKGNIDLKNKSIDVHAQFVSLPKDSLSTLDITGDIKDPKIEITAISRGERRPGITPNLNN